MLFQSHLGVYLASMGSECIVEGAVLADHYGTAGDVAAIVGEDHVEVSVGGVRGEDVGGGGGLRVAALTG